MADELDENYTLDKKFKVAEPIDDLDDLDELQTKSNKFDKPISKETSNSKKIKTKKKNITEILEIKKKELNKPSYAYDEFKRILTKFIVDNLSSVERKDFGLNENLNEKLDELIVKRTKTSKLPFEQQFEKFFSKKFEKHLQKESKLRRPFTIVLCSSAVRCIELQKKLDSTNELIKKKKLKWMHAFAKHKKLQEQIDFIKNSKTPIHLVYATPQRLAQLVEADALKLNLLKYVCIDYTARDCKLKRFVDIPDLKEEFLKFINKFLFKLNKEKIKFKFYLA